MVDRAVHTTAVDAAIKRNRKRKGIIGESKEEGVMEKKEEAVEKIEKAIQSAGGLSIVRRVTRKKRKKTSTKPVEAKKVKEPKPVEESAKKKIRGGQGGDVLDLSRKRLNDKESVVIAGFRDNGSRATLKGLIEYCSGDSVFEKAGSTARTASWVRNSLRRLIRGKLVAKTSRGHYELTAQGKDR